MQGGCESAICLKAHSREDAIAEAKERGIYSGKEHTNVVQAQEGSMMTSKVEEYRAALSRITDDQV